MDVRIDGRMECRIKCLSLFFEKAGTKKRQTYNLDRDLAQQNEGNDLDLNCLKLWHYS